MRQTGVVLAVALAILGVVAGGGTACTVLLETDTNPYKCVVDAECTRYESNAVCDTARKQCVTRLPGPGAGGADGGLTCQLSFDNRSRLPLDGPDGGLRPLPEAP